MIKVLDRSQQALQKAIRSLEIDAYGLETRLRDGQADFAAMHLLPHMLDDDLRSIPLLETDFVALARAGRPGDALDVATRVRPAIRTEIGRDLIWLRGGTSPEVWHTTFDASTNNGTDWFSLGVGTRISAGPGRLRTRSTVGMTFSRVETRCAGRP